jgi:hypothetical protein
MFFVNPTATRGQAWKIEGSGEMVHVASQECYSYGLLGVLSTQGGEAWKTKKRGMDCQLQKVAHVPQVQVEEGGYHVEGLNKRKAKGVSVIPLFPPKQRKEKMGLIIPHTQDCSSCVQ